jgi:hypothetical protein
MILSLKGPLQCFFREPRLRWIIRWGPSVNSEEKGGTGDDPVEDWLAAEAETEKHLKVFF